MTDTPESKALRLCPDSTEARGGVLDMDDDHATADIVKAIRDLCPARTVAEGGLLSIADHSEILPEESALSQAVPERLREFRAGRLYSRRALSRLGVRSGPIPVGPDRAPIWPAGSVGSISHTRHLCCVVAGLTADWSGIGIDVEGDEPLSAEVTKLVTQPSELEGRSDLEGRLGCDLPKLVFVVKEAFYKMHFPLNRRFLDFQDVTVAIDAVACSAQVRVISPETIFAGRFDVCSGTLFACFAVPAPMQACVEPSP